MHELEDWGLNHGPFSFTNLPQKIRRTCVMSLSFLLFWRCALRQLKMVNIIYFKLTDQIVLHFFLILKGLKLVSSLYYRARNKLEMFVYYGHNIWWNFILRLLTVRKKHSKVYHIQFRDVYDVVTDFEVNSKNTKI